MPPAAAGGAPGLDDFPRHLALEHLDGEEEVGPAGGGMCMDNKGTWPGAERRG